MSKFMDWITGKPANGKQEPPPPPKPQEKPAPSPVTRSAQEQQKQAYKDRAKTPGPAERYVVKNPDVLQKAVDAKAEREQPKPTKNVHNPPSVPKQGPTIQTPSGPVRVTAPSSQPKPAPPSVPRKPTNADRMIDRAQKSSGRQGR